MKIFIAMATYNGERYIREQLKSLADQSHLPYEFVVGDDGSTKTLKILKEYRERTLFPVRSHCKEINQGICPEPPCDGAAVPW